MPKNYFINSFNSITIKNNSLNNIVGTATRINFRENILSGLGEYFERVVVVNFANSICNHDKIKGYNMITKNIEEINLKSFSNQVYFLDTCGCASHKNSIDAINNAFEEFVDRQSLIFRYLTKTVKYQLIIDDNSIYTSYSEILKNFSFFDISLVDGMFVILSIGEFDKNICIGIGKSYNIQKALENSIKESLQLLNFYIAKNKEEYLKKIYNIKEKDYLDIFLGIESEKIIYAYRFLNDSKKKINYQI